MAQRGEVWMFELQQYNRISFRMHNEVMKEFRRRHGRVILVNPTGFAEHGITTTTAPLTIRCVSADYGGSDLKKWNTDLDTSLLLPRVAHYKLSSN
jgi:hypothetical protein